MAKVEKTPAEWAKWIDEMYASAPNPAAIPPLVEDLLIAARDFGRDDGIEAVALQLDLIAEEGPDEGGHVDASLMNSLRAIAATARSLKKGQGQ